MNSERNSCQTYNIHITITDEQHIFCSPHVTYSTPQQTHNIYSITVKIPVFARCYVLLYYVARVYALARAFMDTSVPIPTVDPLQTAIVLFNPFLIVTFPIIPVSDSSSSDSERLRYPMLVVPISESARFITIIVYSVISHHIGRFS